MTTPVPTGADLKRLQEDGKHSLARLILPIYRAFNALAQEKYAERGHAGLTTSHTLLFANLDEGGTRIVTLAARMGTTKQFTGRLVHQLEEKRYLQTEPDPQDRRATIVRATEAGLVFFADACAVKTEIEAMFTSIVGEEKLAGLMEALQKLSEAFASYETVGSVHPMGDDSEEL
jgi:DNA-binding MarR family transcriptional regulator